MKKVNDVMQDLVCVAEGWKSVEEAKDSIKEAVYHLSYREEKAPLEDSVPEEYVNKYGDSIVLFDWKCPNCFSEYRAVKEFDLINRPDYCMWCGQALHWDEGDMDEEMIEKIYANPLRSKREIEDWEQKIESMKNESNE